MNHQKISTRLGLLICALSACLLAIGGAGLYGIGRSSAALQSMYEDNVVGAAQFAEIQRLQLRNRALVTDVVLKPEPQDIVKNTAEVESDIVTLNKLFDLGLRAATSPKQRELAEAFRVARADYVDKGLLPAVKALRNNRVSEARRVTSEDMPPLEARVNAAISAIIQFQVDESKRQFTEAKARDEAIRAGTLAAVALCVSGAGLFGMLMIRGIGRSLKEAIDVAGAVARGDLHQAIHTGSNTEVGLLLKALAAMRDRLATVVGTVRQSAEGLDGSIGEIASGNTDLSHRTEQQAATLEETASSMEELSTTIHRNTDNARFGFELATGANTVAVQGGELISEVVDTMKGINDSSKRIADIITVIDGIAFQTNILALNAAVEAARAGEQGRGFAVVASEVRSLAQHSANAAKEIKGLIHASVDRVEAGTELVSRARTTITEVVQSIRRVTDIMGEISTASLAQSAGVKQVSQAITLMDQNIQQNSALVEQSAAASESLKLQSEQLVGAVAVFRLDAGRGASV
ncbi:MAG: methyl-accepting chemotaxis protein [Pseudomonadota bacterium]|nr:methyl-accepting chemotaxis protein [Pseudomonadota bacterium]